MKRKYGKQARAHKSQVEELQRRVEDAGQLQLLLDREELILNLQEDLHSFAVNLGLKVAEKLLEDEVNRLCGPRYKRQEGRILTRFGKQPGVITVAGQKLPIERPRVRHTDGRGEASLEMYALLQQEDAMPEACLKRMARGVSCRDYEGAIDMAQEGFGVKKSSVSRNFVEASAEAVKELAERRFDGVRFVAIFIDGVEYADETLVVCMGLVEDGTKHVIGLRQGATENAEVVTSLLEELRDRGVDTSRPTLFVLDGSKALAAAVKRVFGRHAVIQRCQIHKKRNVKAHVPERFHDELEGRLWTAWRESDYLRAWSQMNDTVRWLEGISPDAAASLREGMEDTLTVIRLGIPPTLRRTLSTTNPIESALDMVRTMTWRVKHWQPGDMRLRWSTIGLLKAEGRFNRVKGFTQIAQLVATLDSLTLDSKPRAS